MANDASSATDASGGAHTTGQQTQNARDTNGHDHENTAGQDSPQAGHGRDRTMYQTPPALMREQIVVLLNYPKVGPLGANTIAINLGTLQQQVDPLLRELVKEGNVRQTEHDQHFQYSGEDIQRPRAADGL